MIGFHATADDSTPLEVDTDELEGAGWFGLEEVRAAAKVPGSTLKHDPGLAVLLPPKGVIARELIDSWLERQPARLVAVK